MNNYNQFLHNLNLNDLDKLSLEEQNVKLKVELEACYCEKQDLLNHITFLNNQISKYINIIDETQNPKTKQ